MTTKRTKGWLLASAGLLTCLAAPATAQVAQDQVTTVDEVIVTLQKREQSIVEVPTALTAYNGEFLQRIGVQDFSALGLFTPGFDVQDQSPNNPGFVMRGITSDSGEAYIEPRVSVFQDGVSISKARGSYVELFDIERVEIAKGPQSTLFGRGALIGAVNIIQNKASLAGPDAALTFGAGDYGYLLAEGMVNAPLSDTLAVRGAFRYRHREGYVESLLAGEDFNSIETGAARLSILWAPSDRVSADLILNYQTDTPSGTAFRSRTYLPAVPATGAPLGTLNPWDPAALQASPGFVDGQALGLDREVYGATALVDIELNDAWSLSSITAVRRFNALEVFDPDGFGLPLLTAAEDAEGDQFSQELRLNYDGGGRVRGFVGVGYFDEDGTQRTPAQFNERLAVAHLAGVLDGDPTSAGVTALPLAFFNDNAFMGQVVQGVVASQTGGAYTLSTVQAQAIAANLNPAYAETATNGAELRSFDVFGDVAFDVTDRFEVGLGLRYTSDEKTSTFESGLLNGAQRSIIGGVLGALQVLGAGDAATAFALLGSPLTPGVPGALGVPGAAFIPTGAAYPVPNFGVTFQPTSGRQSQDLDDDGLTWRLTGRYAVSQDTSLYANYARGRRPAVLSVAAPSAPPGVGATGGQARFNEVEAETVDSFEVGAKTVGLMDGRLNLDGAVFYYAYDNFQTTVQQGTQFIVTNAGEATSYGFEGQAYLAASDWLDVFGTYAYNRSRFDTGEYDGNRFRLSPDHQASIGATARFALGQGELRITPTYTWQSEVFFDDNNDRPELQTVARGAFVADLIQDEVQDSYGLLNLRVAYGPLDGRWEVEAFADNLLDEEYIKDAGNTGDSLGLPTFIAGAPAMFGAQVKLRY